MASKKNQRKSQKKNQKTKMAKKKVAAKPVKKKTTKASAKSSAKVAAKTPAKTKTTGAPRTVLFKFHPLDDRVLVEREEALSKTAGGIFIPDTATDAPNRGTVVSVGPGHKGKKGFLRPTDVKPGQRVIFNKYSGNELKLGNKDYVIMRETDIIGIVEE